MKKNNYNNDMVRINLSDDTNSIDRKSIEFVDTLIHMTENGTLKWIEMDYGKYKMMADSVKEKAMRYRNNTLSPLQTAAAALAQNMYLSAAKTIEKKAFYVHSSNNVIIFFIRQIDFCFSFPVTDYSLELISDNDDLSKCYVYETEFSDSDIKKETLRRLDEAILPDDYDSNTSNQAMNFMDDVINGNVKFDK